MSQGYTIGRCIYCGSREPPLSREHVVPEGLGGQQPMTDTGQALVLRSASCQSCQKITSALEKQCLKGMGVSRHKFGLSRKDRRPAAASIQVTRRDGSERFEDVDFDVAMAGLALPSYERANLLAEIEGGPRTTTFSMWTLGLLPVEKPDPDVVSMFTSCQLDSGLFSRLLSKIAHGFLVAKLGVDGFRPLVVDSILNGINDPFRFVGGFAPAQLPKTKVNGLHRYKVAKSEHLWVVHIHLFASLGAPQNYVLAGEAI